MLRYFTHRSIRPVLIAAFALLVIGPPAQAAFPGANGKIGFSAIAAPTGPNWLFSVNPDGTDLAAIPNGFGYDISWSPTGRRIAFAMPPEPGSADEIYVMNTNGGVLRRLTFDPGYDTGPSWSSDGTRIAWGRQDGIYVMNADGSGLTQLTNGPDGQPRWSPDGTKIAFSSSRSGNYDVWVMDTDGSNPVNLTSSPSADNDATWSPDGTKLAFISFRDLPTVGVQIFTMDRNGQNQTRLTSSPDVIPIHDAWSPDGTRIAFIAPGATNFNFNVYTVNNSGSDRRQITNNDTFKEGIDWQPLVGPQRSDYKNGADFCKAERDFLGDAAFADTYGANGNSANGKCVSENH